MGCPSEVEIGDNLVFSVTTHDPDTGVLTDADSVPSYRVYEDETSTAILTGNLAKLDDANTTGLYSESIACTAGNGFENGKTYTVYIEATVDSDTGGMSYGFKAYDDRKSNVKKVSDDAGAADNLESACDNYSATRGLAGTALPAAAADAAGGLPISDAGGLDLDAILADTNELQGNQGNWATATTVAVSDKTGFSLANGSIAAATFAAGAVDASALAADAANEIADAVLVRNVSNIEGSAGEHTLCTLVLAGLESSVSGATWTIKRTNGSTTHATKTVATDSGADPITGVS